MAHSRKSEVSDGSFYLVQTFGTAPGVERNEIVELFWEASEKWSARYPNFELNDLFWRCSRLGPLPDWTAIWHMPSIELLQQWRDNRGLFPEIVDIENRVKVSTVNFEARLMEAT